MNLWRFEWLRLWRTQRWLIVIGAYAAFGILGPLTARYLPELMESMGEDVVGTLPAMGPPDGITQYVGNAQQIGLLAVAFVAAAALAVDAKTEIAVFFRTRASITEIVVPRFVANAVLAAVAFALGMLIAYVGTGILLDWLDLDAILVGTLLQMLYMVFVVAVIAFFGSLVRGVPATALLSVGTLIAVGLLGLVPRIDAWLPGQLVGAVDDMIRGGGFEYWRATASTVLLTGLLLRRRQCPGRSRCGGLLFSDLRGVLFGLGLAWRKVLGREKRAGGQKRQQEQRGGQWLSISHGRRSSYGACSGARGGTAVGRSLLDGMGDSGRFA